MYTLIQKNNLTFKSISQETNNVVNTSVNYCVRTFLRLIGLPIDI